MSSEVFENREDDFRAIIDKLRRKIEDQIPRSVGEEKKRLVREAERNLEDATVLLQEMEEEVKKAPNPYRSNLNSKVRQYNRDLEQLSRDIRRATTDSGNENFGFARGDEFESAVTFGAMRPKSSHSSSQQGCCVCPRPQRPRVDIAACIKIKSMASSQRAKLIKGTESLNRASESVIRSQRIAAETDQIGVDIIDELGTQRESLVRTRDRLGETDSNLVKSRKILNTMSRRVMTNKMILIFIIILEVGILAGVVYWKFFSK